MSHIALFWHRRDLRTHDNRGLAAALNSGLPTVGFFCFDRNILDHLPKRDAARGVHPHRVGQGAVPI